MGKNKVKIDDPYIATEIMLKPSEKNISNCEPTLKNIDRMIRRYLQGQQDKEMALNNVETIVGNIINSFK